MKLDNSIAAVVTGGASGLGAATARAFATVLPDGAPFVEVPRSADVDRLVGTALRADGSPAPGLLRQVDGGVLFLDGIDRFPNKIVEVVLDAHNIPVGLIDSQDLARLKIV